MGKGEHHATTVTRIGKKMFDKRLPHTEPKLRELFADLQVRHGTVLVVVDQPASMSALPPAIARDTGCLVAYLCEGADDGSHRRPQSRRGQDRHEGRTHRRDSRLCAAVHTAGGRQLGRDDRRAGDDRRVRRHPRRRSHQRRQPTSRPADSAPTLAGASVGPAVATPGRPHRAGAVRLPGPDTQGWQAPAGHPAAAEATEDGRVCRESASGPEPRF
ncbi:transposase [Streptomyces sp. NPDC093252]|uniref:IS110 family transposase n=1 Tax=Streptomyces sp. NPDC093252 TaxID=3154980 RepID=UPI00343734D5